jgi:hypothetical protein
MATQNAEQAAVTIPAAYLEDVRSALVDEIDSDSDAIAVDQADLRESEIDRLEMHQADRDAAVRMLSRDLQLLAQVLDATDDTTVTGDPSSIAEALQATVRVLSRRLNDLCGYGPLPLGDVPELAARLRWAADEAIRIEPELARGLAGEAVA